MNICAGRPGALQSRDAPRHAVLKGLRRGGREIFAGVDELVALELVLLIVELLVLPGWGGQFVVLAALDDLARFEHENLVGASDGREAVRDDERRSTATQATQAVLNQR